MYNVGPSHTRPSEGPATQCPGCSERITPEWDGAEGEFRCPGCFEPLPNYEESR